MALKKYKTQSLIFYNVCKNPSCYEAQKTHNFLPQPFFSLFLKQTILYIQPFYQQQTIK